MSLAVVTAIFFGVNSLIVKNLTRRGFGENALVWTNFTIGSIPLVFFALSRGRWTFAPEFWRALPFGIMGNMIAVTLLYRAIRLTKVSIVLPLVALSPIFMLVTSRLMVNESVSSFGLVGILLVVAGAYLLGCSEDRSHPFAPFAALWRDPGARTALLVSIVWSVTANIDKICVRSSDPPTYAAIFSAGLSIAYLPFFLRRSGRASERALWRGSFAILLILGASYSIQAAAHMVALESVPVPYMIAIKRGGVLVGVIHDLVRGEEGVLWSGAGGVLVVAGVSTIIFAA